MARKGTPCGVPSPQAAPPATTGPRVVAVACEWVRGIPVTSAAGPKKAASGAEGRETKPTEWGERHSSEGKTKNAFRRTARQKREEERVGRREKREERRG